MKELIKQETIVFEGRRYCPDGKGYYYNSTTRKRLHQAVWITYNGPIPDGCEIHHKDLNKDNNDIDNLECMTSQEHKALHAALITEEDKEQKRKNLNEAARPIANRWHKSEEGRNWHREHIKQQHKNGVFTKTLICTNCGKEYTGHLAKKGGNTFCSNTCKSAYRRKTGKDLIPRICIICGKEFMTLKGRNAKTCSQSCANKYSWNMRRGQ